MTQSAPSTRDAVVARTQAPSTLGRWRLVEPIGGGRCSRVFRARPVDAPEDSPGDYALKLARTRASGDDDYRLLLQREAYVSRQVSHAHLTSVLAAHVDAPPYYLVLPHLEGRTVADWLSQRPRRNLVDCLWIARQAAEALAALHVGNWRHGDVKPGNLFLAASGHTTLLDLGFAQRINGKKVDCQPLSGTPAYAAPEVLCAAHVVGDRADVYSLGATLFEMLTGVRPFAEEDPVELAAAHRQLPAPDPRKISPDTPLAVARLVRRMLAKEPYRRPSARELIELLVCLEIEAFDQRDWAA
ncbi:MAG: serine/threonine-protein kinase [Pirellulaceae bacterium]